MKLTLAPITFKRAAVWVKAVHSHLPEGMHGWLCGVSVVVDGRVVCVAALARPNAQALQDGFTAEITRCASDATAPHAASKAMAACVRAARALGYRRVFTYTLEHEVGSCVKAVGFVEDGVTRGGEWSRKGRTRKPALESGTKKRWVLMLEAA